MSLFGKILEKLGCPADRMGESAEMNMWLHKAVLQKLVENGGNVPKQLSGPELPVIIPATSDRPQSTFTLLYVGRR